MNTSASSSPAVACGPDGRARANATLTMAKWILLSRDRTLDHACVECVPDGALVVPGFRCGYHSALNAVTAVDDADRQEPAYAPVQAVVDQFVSGYQLHGTLGSHVPTPRERGLIANAIAGLLADTVFLREFDKWRRADAPQASMPPAAAVPADCAGAGEPSTLRNMLAAIRVVGQIDGHDVIRRLSMLDLVDRERRAAEEEAPAGAIALSDAHAKGVMDALRGVHELFVHEDGCGALPPDSPFQNGDQPFGRTSRKPQRTSAMLSEKHHNPHRSGTEAYLATEHHNEGWNGALAAVRKVLGSSLAAAIHYPGCWDTAAYPTIESALAEMGEEFQCTNDDCPHHSDLQQGEPRAFDVAVSGYKVLLVRTRSEADDTAKHFRGRGCEVEVYPLYGGQRFHTLKATDFYELDPDRNGEPGTEPARNVTHLMPEPWPPALSGAPVVPATLEVDNAALAAEIDWCLDEGHCGPRTRAVLQRIRDHQTAGITPARRPMLLITLRQAESLQQFFGGHDAEVAVVPYKDGLLAWDVECPGEGSQWLGPTAVDDELADKGRPDTSRPAIWKTTHPAVCVPITDSKAIADDWKEHGYDVVEFYPGPQELRLCADGVGTANADADGHTV
ncbi:MAG: hypothetical protein ACRYGJ_22515, partial [Janthinobacterium lividum]